MLKHYLKYAIRTFKSNRLIFIGSIVSVFLSALCISLLFTYIHNELSMDHFHKRAKDIYLLTVQQSAGSTVEAIEANLFFDFNYRNYPGIDNLTTIKKYKKGEVKFAYGETSFSPEGIVVDSTFFEIFDFKLKTGDRKTILNDPEAVIITDKFARKLFGSEDPVGQVVQIDERVGKLYTIKGIVESPPSNSSITFDFILPDQSADFSRAGGNFILVNDNFNRRDFVEKIRNLGNVHPQFKNSRMDIMALDDVYFNGGNVDFKGIFSKSGNKKGIYILYAIIGVIFLITLLNFSNLQVIVINESLKNIGINKISGSGSRPVFYQKLVELILLIVLSVILITIGFVIVLPYLNQIIGTELSPRLSQIFLANLVILSLLVASAMIYPSLVFFKVPVLNSLKNQIFQGNQLVGRNTLVIVQFALSFVLLVASIVVAKQLKLMLNKDLGFSSENVICTKLFYDLPFMGDEEAYKEQSAKMEKNFQYINDKLESNGAIERFSQGLSPIEPFSMPWKLKGEMTDYTAMNALTVTPGYLDLLGLKLAEGRFFEKGRDKQRGNQVVINEAAKASWGILDISKARILNKYWSDKDGYEVIGVVKDFNYQHLSVKPQPLVFLYFEDPDADFLIKLKKGATQSGLTFIKQLFNQMNPGGTFNYTFLSDDIEALYQREKRLSEIYIFFSIIAYVISAIGLFAISFYDTRRRTKEIGIRKVNGARISEVMAMLNRDFIRWVTIAFVVACPVAWYAMHKWLENFAYKTTLSWWIFALAGLLALGIALLTVSWQSWKAATRNPVEALRYE